MDSVRTSDDRLRAIKRDDAHGLLIVSREGTIVFADEAAETFFQRKRGTLAGEALVGLLAGGGAEFSLSSAIGTDATVRMSEIQWEGKPAYLAILRDPKTRANGPAPASDSELHYREIVQNTPDLILVSRGGRISYINDAGVKLLRAQNAHELLGRVARDFFHPDYHERIQARSMRLLQAPSVAPLLEEKMVALDGAVIDVEVRAVSFFSRGELVIQVMCRDITDRKHTERELRTAIDRFHQLAEAMPQIVWTSNPGGGIDYASPAFGQYTGITLKPGEEPGLRWLEAVHPDDRTAAAAARVKGQHEGKPYTMEFRVKRYDGVYRWHFVSAVPVHDEHGQLVKWFGSAIDMHDRRTHEEMANKLAQRLASTLEAITDGFVTLDRDWRFTYLNKQAERLLQASREDLIGQNVWDRFPGADAFQRNYRMAIAENRMVEFQEPYPPLNLWLEVRAYPHEDGLAVYFRDITERRELEARLQRAQRLEAVGRLTGGVAHDFNNLLTVIMGNAETLVEKLDDDPRLRSLAQMTAVAAERGAELTQRLLAFARRQALTPKAVDVAELLTGMETLLRRTLGEQVEIELVRRRELWPAFVDASQLEAAILNLCINARDAMPTGGKLTVETSNVTLDDTYARHNEEVTPGEYTMIAVSDTGAGMTPEVVARAFEPFFTTKDVGRGTGLGLSMVHGFIKQSGGHVKIYSEIGHGTTVKLYLPRAPAAADTAAADKPATDSLPHGSERVLLVEDEEQVRGHVAAQVAGLGYRVVAVSNGAEALAALERETFDLLFTDVVMPGGMNGPALAIEARKRQPALHVLYTSGYTENAIVHQGRLDAGVHLLNKPYRRRDLAMKIREALRAR